MKNFVLVAALVLCATALLLAGCSSEPDRPCGRGHNESTLVPMTTIDSKGRASTTYVPGSRFVCDEYLDEAPSVSAE